MNFIISGFSQSVLKFIGVIICNFLYRLFLCRVMFFVVLFRFCSEVLVDLQKKLLVLVGLMLCVEWQSRCMLRWCFRLLMCLLIMDLDRFMCLVVVLMLFSLIMLRKVCMFLRCRFMVNFEIIGRQIVVCGRIFGKGMCVLMCGKDNGRVSVVCLGNGIVFVLRILFLYFIGW